MFGCGLCQANRQVQVKVLVNNWLTEFYIFEGNRPNYHECICENRLLLRNIGFDFLVDYFMDFQRSSAFVAKWVNFVIN